MLWVWFYDTQLKTALLLYCLIAQVIFSQESVKEFEDDEPVTFVTYEFFEHELQTTPVVKGTR